MEPLAQMRIGENASIEVRRIQLTERHVYAGTHSKEKTAAQVVPWSIVNSYEVTFFLVASDALIEIATKDILSSAPIPGINVNLSVVVSVPFILLIFLMQAVICSIVVILACILA